MILAFITYPQALSVFPGGQIVGVIFSLLFFIMLFALARLPVLHRTGRFNRILRINSGFPAQGALYITCAACAALSCCLQPTRALLARYRRPLRERRQPALYGYLLKRLPLSMAVWYQQAARIYQFHNHNQDWQVVERTAEICLSCGVPCTRRKLSSIPISGLRMRIRTAIPVHRRLGPGNRDFCARAYHSQADRPEKGNR